MFRDPSSQILALARSRPLGKSKMVNIGGRPVIVPKENPAVEKRSESIKVALAFIAIYLVWGSTYLAIRYAVETIPPLVTAGIRHTIAGGILLAWALIRGYRPRREHWIAGIVVGALFFLIGHVIARVRIWGGLVLERILHFSARIIAALHYSCKRNNGTT